MEFSKTKQSFKIGRMTYSLPSYVDVKDKGRHNLHFFYSGYEWYTGYLSKPIYGSEESLVLFCKEPTFNKALKALHQKVKQHTDGK